MRVLHDATPSVCRRSAGARAISSPALSPAVPRADARSDAAALAAAARRALAAPELPLPGSGRTLQRWRALAAIAATDLCLVKVMEAHYDAVAILAELGGSAPPAGELLAVWAAEPPDARLGFEAGEDGRGTLSGEKAWCSGADLVDAALVTAHCGGRRCLVRVDLRQRGIVHDPAAWQAVGMGRVTSGRVRFESVPARMLGAPGDYLSRPGFWHGGAGIAACWYGGAAAIGQTLRTHPKIAGDAHAAAHLGAVDMALGGAAALLRELAARIDAEPALAHAEDTIRARSVVERACGAVVDRVGRALGPAPLCGDRTHALRCADLATFVRQSHAEHDWAALGRAAAERDGAWTL
ncbi:acyl-CoA dehydrogenase [Luteimonas sp. RD2P54]|uniref:Acyl-CoA dehydrogenase n=1 Tax=Luteimonas endophytica TaxID=3042023 RepID=A0ABT6JB79_9GAMM|nr:acyl-CoA dehydrogenase [Luteimonas endophytica]MDH5824080.1 acyl-CoA dehydrogenase [Luteimonas endophytica]